LTPDQSKATFRVQEQLARLKVPSEAVGSTGKVTGQIVVTMDGSVVSDESRVTVDMTDLRTDDQLRDGLIKRTTLETQRYGTAEFVPTAAHGLPSPIPESGEYTFQLTGLTTIHGVQRELTWDVTAKRQGSALNATASTQFHFGDFGMEPPRAPVVLAVTDNIRLEIQIVATQG
jgi:polyisoprenoid-binding protein YceI